MAEQSIKLYRKLIWIVLAVYLVLIGVVLFLFRVNDVTMTQGEIYSMNKGWQLTREDHSVEQIDLPCAIKTKQNEIITLEIDIPQEYAGMTISFLSADKTVQAFMDGRLIYEFGTKDERLFGHTPGSVVNYIDIPLEYDGHMMINMYSPYEGYAGNLASVHVGRRDVLILNSIKNQMLPIIINLTILVCGIILLILIIMEHRSGRETQGMLYLVLMSVVTAVYGFIETKLLSVFYGNQTLYSLLIFLCLMVMPLLLSLYDVHSFLQDYKKHYAVFMAVSFTNVGLQILLQLFGVLDFLTMAAASHLLIGMQMLLTLWCGIHLWRRTENEQVRIRIRTELIAILLLAVCQSIDMIRNYLVKVGDFSKYSRIGFMIFGVAEVWIHLKRVALGYADTLQQKQRYEELEHDLQLEEDTVMGVAPKARILLVDDLPMNQKIILGLLKRTLVQVDIAHTGAECLELLQQKKYHMIFMDNVMSDMDGTQVMQFMKELDGNLNADTPLIMQTTMSGFAAKEECKKLGYTDFLKKPVRESMLMRLLVTYIPVELMEDAASVQAAETEHVNELEEMAAEILVVDDDLVNRKLATKILQSRYKVHCVASGEDAIAHIEEHLPDLILLDLLMPGMDGFEVLKVLKSEERTAVIPVIFLTAETDQAVQVQMLKKGAVDLVTKPFIAELMIQKIGKALSEESQKRDLQQDVNQRTEELQQKNEQLDRLFKQVMETLSGTIDAKDKYTNGHSRRVAEYSRELAAYLGKSSKEQEDIYYVGLLHDVGKIGVPDEIINKTAKLTDEEYAIIKTHPVIGSEIMENISEMPNLKIGARWHHERYDGRGYPDGLAGEEIPEWARIIGVADAYDAMTSKRSYRDVLPQAVVRGEIEKGRGTQFDPIVADAMLALIDADVNYEKVEH